MSTVHSRAYQTFLERLRRARRECKLTQLDVADQLGVYSSFVSKCESGERRVDIIELLRFAKAYRKPVSYFHKGIEV